jgi:HlyD family secretion protein
VLSAFGCGQNESEVRDFAFSEITVGPLIDSVLATGRVHTVKNVDVSSQLSGRIDEVYVDFNDIVSEGDPLARLDPLRFQSRVEELDAALTVAEAELASVEAALEGAQARFDEDERDLNRKLDLARKGSVSESEVSRSRAIKLQSESDLRILAASKAIKTATIVAAKASLRQAQIDLDRTTIRAPINGVVIKRMIEPGQTVAASLSAPELFVIANDLAEIELHARVDEADIGKVQAGQRVTFSVDAHPGRKFEGSVRQIRKAPEISQNVVVYSVVIDAANPGELMLPGMTALVEIITARKDEVLQIANAALRFEMPPGALQQSVPTTDLDPTKPAAWLVKDDGTYQRISLEIGYSDGNFSEIRSGNLLDGDRVIVGYR